MNNQLQITDNNQAIALLPFNGINGIIETNINDGIQLINYDDITFHKVKRFNVIKDIELSNDDILFLIYYENEYFDTFIMNELKGYTVSELIDYLICIDIDMHLIKGFKCKRID